MSKYTYNSKFNKRGFTLVELLVVISLVGILAGVTISIINPVKQRKVAEDGVRQSNLLKFALGVEAYGNANSRYPTVEEMAPDALDADGDGNKLEPVNAEVAVFVGKIPNDEPTTGTIYSYYVSGDKFAISVPKSDTTTSECFKYRSDWGKIMTCPDGCDREAVVSACY